MKYLILLLFPIIAQAAEVNEAAYRDKFCASVGGQTEVVTSIGTRADCMTQWGAFELDYMKKSMKWAEMLGQAMHYAALLHKHAVAVPIVESESDCVNLRKAYAGADNFDIIVMETGDYAYKCPK